MSNQNQWKVPPQMLFTMVADCLFEIWGTEMKTTDVYCWCFGPMKHFLHCVWCAESFEVYPQGQTHIYIHTQLQNGDRNGEKKGLFLDNVLSFSSFAFLYTVKYKTWQDSLSSLLELCNWWSPELQTKVQGSLLLVTWGTEHWETCHHRIHRPYNVHVTKKQLQNKPCHLKITVW